jgi:hypothetical protein
VNPTRSTAPPPWVLEPAAAWVYLGISVVLAFTPVFPLVFVLGVLATVFTYLDRSAHGFPALWWTVGVFFFGSLAYLAFVYRRPRHPVMYSPAASVAQQSRLVRGLPPQTPASAQGSNAPADWYPDPKGEGRLRYWNGTNWTEHTAV